MYVHKEAKLIFLANPRTASTSVAKALMEIGFEKEGAHHSGQTDLRPWPTFAVVRNHWDAAVSWVFGLHKGEYKDLVVSVPTIEFALDNNGLVFDGRMFPHRADGEIHYENLQNELNRVLFYWDLPEVDLPWLNVSTRRNGRHYREFHTDETRDYVHSRFKDEIESLGYEF